MIHVAIIGAGPKALFALERLLGHLADCDAGADITVFDPRPPGSGSGYAVDQPGYLRLNVTAAIVDAGWRDGGVPGPPLPDFADWRRRAGEPEPLDPFPPRARVGAYLADCWQRLLGEPSPGVRVTHRAQRVDDVRAAGGGWLIGDDHYDEVLLATGHADDWPGALAHDWSGAAGLVPRAYPVGRTLTDNAVPAGSLVACRGAALTFIDVALALTEGRGGVFAATGYRRSGREPAAIRPVGRRGRFMEVKPQPGGVSSEARAKVIAAGRRRVRTAGSDVEALLAAVRDTAQRLLSGVGGGALDDDDFTLPVPADPVAALRASLMVAQGRRAPATAGALGAAWRELYPAIVATLADHPPAPDAWQRFAQVAARLEPVAFGPPPVNATKLLALCEAGLVGADHLGADWAGAADGAEIVIDCVLPPPGLVPGQWPWPLLERGLLTRAPGRRGIAIDRAGSCLDARGTVIGGLAAIGRPTEDVVIGNDTLSRTLHDTAPRWAARVAARAGRERIGAKGAVG